MQKAVAILLAMLLPAAPAASGGEAEERFHEAYALEVVEGNVKGAALVYLSLMEDEDAPVHLRAESKFRFAVCAVLLGRADEARTHLSDLIADADTPATVRKKAEDYRAAVSGIGLGTELEKKLQSLVFDLGRVTPYESVTAYRDFEIIGKPALPFLRKMLDHTDANLRIHAYRLLCRMNEPGMAARWTSEIGVNSQWFCMDLKGYLERNPEELAAFEQRVLTLGEPAVAKLARMQPAPSFSLAFMWSLVEKKSGQGTALAFVGWAGEPAPRHALITEWIIGDDVDLSRETSQWLLTYVAKTLPEDLATEAVFAAVIGRLAGPGTTYRFPSGPHAELGLQHLARSRTVPELLGALGRVIDASEKWDGSPFLSPAAGSMPETIASMIDLKVGPDTDHAAYTALLDRWVVVQRKLQEAFAKQGYSKRPVPDAAMVGHYATAVRAMPEDRAVPEIRRLLDRYEVGPQLGNWSRLFEPTLSAMRIRIIVETLRTAAPADRLDLVQRLPFVNGHAREPEVVEAQLAAVVEVVPLLNLNGLRVLSSGYPALAMSGERDRAREIARAVLRLIPELGASQRQGAIHLAAGYYNRNEPYVSQVLVPVAEQAWDRLGPYGRKAILNQMTATLATYAPGSPDPSADRDAVVAFISARYGELEPGQFDILARYPDLFPPEEWIPVGPTHVRLVATLDPTEKDRIARILAKDVAQMNEASIIFIIKYASPEFQKEVYERGIRHEDPSVRQRFVLRLSRNGEPAGVPALEAALAVVLAEKSPDLKEVRVLSRFLLSRQPSEKLFPAARTLLSSSVQEYILTGISIARSLGREDLVPDLARLLDSMNAELRTKAKDAIDSIEDIARIKRERALKDAGRIPK